MTTHRIVHISLALAVACCMAVTASYAGADDVPARVTTTQSGSGELRTPRPSSDAERLLSKIRSDAVNRGSTFTQAWDYIDPTVGAGESSVFRDAVIDIEGNIIAVGAVFSGGGATGARIIKINGADNDSEDIIYDIDLAPFGFTGLGKVVTDLDGFVYAGGTRNGQAVLVKISPLGFITWISGSMGPASSAPVFSSLAIDPEGIPYGIADVDFQNEVARFDPVSGGIVWQSIAGSGSTFSMFVSVDRRGNLFLLDGVTDTPMLHRLDQYTGNEVWATPFGANTDGFAITSPSFASMVTDFDCNIYVAGGFLPGDSTERFAGVFKFSPDGAIIDQNVGTSITGTPNNGFYAYKYTSIALDPVTGNIYTTWRVEDGFDLLATFVFQFNPSLNLQWSRQVGSSTRPVSNVALDRIGGAYVMSMNQPVGGQTIKKIFSDNSAQVTIADPVQPGFTDLTTLKLLVDPGGSVISAGRRFDDVSNDGAHRIVKWTQDFLSQPIHQTACANLTFENQSIWAPGQGSLEASEELFSLAWDEGVDEGGIVSVPLIGDFGGTFVFNTTGTLSAGVKAEINGGTADVQFPIDMEWIIPSDQKLIGGVSQVDITSTFSVDPAARLTSCFTPTFNAGLTAGTNYTVYSEASLVAFSLSIFDTVFVNLAREVADDYIPGLNLLDILALVGFPVPGDWASIDLPPKGLFTAEFRTPQLFAQGRYDSQSGMLTTVATDRFFVFGISVTDAILRTVGASSTIAFSVPPPIDTGDDDPPQGGGGDPPPEEDEEPPDFDFSIEGSATLLNLIAKIDIGARQQIDVTPALSVRYDFSDSVNVIGAASNPTVTHTQPLGQTLSFTLPGDGIVDIVPTLLATSHFENNTDIEIFPGIIWKTLETTLTATAFGFDLISLGPFCILCYDWDLAEILEALGVPNPTAVNISLSIFPLKDFNGTPLFDNFWDIPFPDTQLPCMRVVGAVPSAPRLVTSSRPTASMIIYDQTSPSVGKFNVAVNGTMKMLLYGDFFCDQPSPASPCNGTQAFIEHHGRIEAIPTTPINRSTCLIEIPNRIRLLPGVARLWLENDILPGTMSDTIDLVIEYPAPRLDTVNPNIWAADPDLAVLPVSVIDGKTTFGNDTFIARRDYFIKMRDDLWNTATLSDLSGGEISAIDNGPTGDGDGEAEANEYFPYFDFNQLPAFPSVLWGGEVTGVPLPRFIQPVDNGIHNVRLAEGDYDRPALVRVVLCNPAPGGGISNPINLTIAAPIPVVSRVEPNGMSPVDIRIDDDDGFTELPVGVAEPVELRVHGPHHVPTFNGYEEPKFGNFNADSKVHFDGIELPTTFTSSFLITAELDPIMVTLGDHYITVVSPSNGTQYFEELRTDADFDGAPDDPPAFQGLVDSGGESAPLLFRIRYRLPNVTVVSPPKCVVDSPAFDDAQLSQPRTYNMSLQGTDFRDGAVVFFNGHARTTFYQGPNMLRVKLLPGDVAVEGTFPITVQNPAPDFRVSTLKNFFVVPAPPAQISNRNLSNTSRIIRQ